MNGYRNKPIVWEINAPSHEMLKLNKERFTDASGKNTLFDKIRAKIEFFKLKKRVLNEERFRLNYAKKLSGAVCVSEQLKTYAIEGLGILNSVVISNGSDPSKFSPEKKRTDLFKGFENYFKVIYSGDSRWPWQGFDIISELTAIASSRNLKLLFVVMDSSASETTLQRENLLILSRINYTDVSSYIASADACLCLYHDFPWSPYGFYLSPLKLFDYMACGKPVIASSLGQISEVIDDGKNGLLTTNNVEDIFEKIVMIKENTQLSKKVGSEARKTIIKKYNWAHSAKQTYSTFESIVSKDI